MDEYIHYGHKEFCQKLFNNVRNIPIFPKPDGGFWASKVNAKYGWKDWCENNDFRECSDNNCYRFYISEDANILTINSIDDLEPLPKQKTDFVLILLDFEKMLSSGIDAIELNISSDPRLYMALYGWDCDSILIMNPDVIKK